MFLSNANSFVLIRRKTAVKPISPELLPSSDSFVLAQKMDDKFISPIFLPSSHSFVLKRNTIIKSDLLLETKDVTESVTQSIDIERSKINDSIFLPNANSFVLIQKTGNTPIFPTFLPNAHSFILKRSTVIEPNLLLGDGTASGVISQETVLEESKINDHKKRHFLKVASIAGAGIVASQLLPKKAEALIMGSSPTTGIVGVKNSTNTRINPATEETVSTLATEATAATLLKTSDLTFDAGALEVKITGVAGSGSSSFSDSGNVARSALVDADRHVQVDVLSSVLPSAASTETTLQTIAFGGVQYSIRLETVGDLDYVGQASVGTATSSANWRIKRIDNSSGDIVVLWADGDETFDNIWDNRASLSYS